MAGDNTSIEHLRMEARIALNPYEKGWL